MAFLSFFEFDITEKPRGNAKIVGKCKLCMKVSKTCVCMWLQTSSSMFGWYITVTDARSIRYL